jgi:Cu/Ag efflux protein CusF
METAMTTWRRFAIGLTAGTLLSAGTAMAQMPATQQPAGTPERVAGQVTRIDQATGKVTIQADGKTYEFQASAETLKDLKVGDRIEAKLRK